MVDDYDPTIGETCPSCGVQFGHGDQCYIGVSPEHERAIRQNEQRRLAERFHNVAWRDPRLEDARDRNIVHWVASMIRHWSPPADDVGRVDSDGKKWAPLDSPRCDWDGTLL